MHSAARSVFWGYSMETQNNRRASILRLRADPEFRARLDEGLMNYRADPAARAAQSERMRKYHKAKRQAKRLLMEQTDGQ